MVSGRVIETGDVGLLNRDLLDVVPIFDDEAGCADAPAVPNRHPTTGTSTLATRAATAGTATRCIMVFIAQVMHRSFF